MNARLLDKSDIAKGEDRTRPLLTLIVIAYNQEAFIREAVLSALAQTYEPLEVILSDDCSTDATFQIIEDTARDYSGPHSIMLNRNVENLGIGAHVQKLHKMAGGSLILHAAGDDISLPNRARRVYESWSDAEVKPSLLISNAVRISESGEELGTLVEAGTPRKYALSRHPMNNPFPMLGCTVAIERQLVDSFPPILSGIMAEDVVLYRRAHLCNGILYIPETLVRYRLHESAASQQVDRSQEKYIRSQRRWTQDRLLRCIQLRSDLDFIEGRPDATILRDIQRYEVSERRRQTILGNSFFEAARALAIDLILGPKKWTRYKVLMKDFAIRWAPRLVGYD